MSSIEQLSDAAAVTALLRVASEWAEQRGLEATVVVAQTYGRAGAAVAGSPGWARGAPEPTPEAGIFARRMLEAMVGGLDAEVATWTDQAVKKARAEASAQVLDPISLSIVGVIIIGGILAARVKRIGSVEFYEGVPKELADVLKAGAGIAAPDSK
jgi:hypothetical protein